MTKLYSRASEGISLKQAVSDCAQLFPESVALLYSPTRCLLARCHAGRLTDAQANEISLDSVFEVRMFNPEIELRWLNQQNGEGRAVLLSECGEMIDSYLERALAETPEMLLPSPPQLPQINTIDQTYVLWGQGAETTLSYGWSRLTAARIGALDVPIAGVKPQQYVQLKVREYLGVVDDYGNVAVVEERLLALEAK